MVTALLNLAFDHDLMYDGEASCIAMLSNRYFSAIISPFPAISIPNPQFFTRTLKVQDTVVIFVRPLDALVNLVLPNHRQFDGKHFCRVNQHHNFERPYFLFSRPVRRKRLYRPELLVTSEYGPIERACIFSSARWNQFII
jgi:hypothetical protein